MQESKPCSRCKQIKPFTEFNKKAGTPTGYNSACRECANAMKRDMTPEQRERKNLLNRQYRADNPEAVKRTNRNQYLNKREERIASATEWVAANPEKHRGYQAISRKKRRLQNAADARRRRARLKLNGVFYISNKELDKLLNSLCFYCGEKLPITIDHVIAIDRGGRDSIGNITPACKSCNSSKRELTIMEWRKWRASRGKPPLVAYAQPIGAFRYLP